MRRLILLASLLLASTLAAQPYHKLVPPDVITEEHLKLRALYDKAIYDASVYKPAHVRKLRPLRIDANGEVLGATLTSLDGKRHTLITAGDGGIWITGVPEVQDICRTWTGDIKMKLRQLIGLPPDAHIPYVLTLRVKASDVFRPSPHGAITTTMPCTQLQDAPIPAECGNLFSPDATPEHYQWLAQQTFELHEIPDGYPWTHLGYTYNWAPDAPDRYGASEYVIRGGADAFVVSNQTPEEYCAPPN
jgi:hypothetical protein